MKEFAIIATVCIVGLCLLVSPIIGLAAFIDSTECSSKSAAMEFEKSWGPFQGCMIRVDGKFMPLASYKVVKVRP